MGILEITLLVAGAVIFIGSFCIPVKEEKLKEETRNLALEEVKGLVSEELERVRDRLSELAGEEMSDQIEKSERSMERISNEKIMAVNEYSDTVLEEIHKNHEEVVFLYDMLKNKKEGLSESYGKADQNLQELLQQLKDSEITLRENMEATAAKQKELSAMKEEAEAILAAVRAEASSRRAVETGFGEIGSAAPEGASGENAPAAESTAPGKKKTASVRRTKKTSQKPEIEENGGQDAPGVIPDGEREEASEQTAETGQPAGAAENGFKPFVPERVEVSPKKTRKGKTTKSQAVKEPPAESAEVMLLLADTMGDGASANSNERILELHKAGKSNMAIARELGLGIGEVKLVIDLYESVQ